MTCGLSQRTTWSSPRTRTDGTSSVVYTYDGLDRIATRDTDDFVYQGAGLDPISDGVFTWAQSPGGRVLAQTDGTTPLLAGQN